MRFVYQSPTTPRQWFDYDMATRERTLRKTQEIPSGHDPARYVARRLYATAADGGRGADHRPDAEGRRRWTARRRCCSTATAPTASPMEPSFSIRNLSLVDRGWIWATAHIRGGSDKG